MPRTHRTARASTGEVRLGTSGWQYRDWRGLFDPEGSKVADWFARPARPRGYASTRGGAPPKPSRRALEGYVLMFTW